MINTTTNQELATTLHKPDELNSDKKDRPKGIHPRIDYNYNLVVTAESRAKGSSDKRNSMPRFTASVLA